MMLKRLVDVNNPLLLWCGIVPLLLSHYDCLVDGFVPSLGLRHHKCGRGGSFPLDVAARRKRRRKDRAAGSDEPTERYDDDDDRRRQPNRRERMEAILERDGSRCVWCAVPLNIDSATTDHVVPRLKGGPSWIENEVASCRECNKERGHASALEWIDACRETRSYEPDERAVEACLFALRDAIDSRGGQRRARPHLDRQLRLLEKRKRESERTNTNKER